MSHRAGLQVNVLGVDPGPTPGFVLLPAWPLGEGTPFVVQCNLAAVHGVFRGLLTVDPKAPTLVQVERFVVGRRASRSSHAHAGEVTRNLVGALREVWEDFDSTPQGRLGGHWFERSAAQVKPWATDERLDAAGLLAATKGMTHARDAARHAIFAAVHDGGIPDPLSRRSNR